MIIETKLNEGDIIFFITNLKKVSQSIVRGVDARIVNGKRSVIYLCNEKPDEIVNIKVCEEDGFPTKEALLQSL